MNQEDEDMARKASVFGEVAKDEEPVVGPVADAAAANVLAESGPALPTDEPTNAPTDPEPDPVQPDPAPVDSPAEPPSDPDGDGDDDSTETDPGPAAPVEDTPVDDSPAEAELVVDIPITPSYVVLAHILGNPGGPDHERGYILFEDELGGPKNVQRLLDSHSIAPSDSDEAVVAHREYAIAAAAVKRAKERGN